MAIIFFTDGQNNYGYEKNFDEVKGKLHYELSSTDHVTEVHSIGFTAYHDAGNIGFFLLLLVICNKNKIFTQ